MTELKTSNLQLSLVTERLATDPGIDPFLRRDVLVELKHLSRKLREAESAEIDFKAEIERLRAALERIAKQCYQTSMVFGCRPRSP